MPEKCREIKDVWSLSSFLSGEGMIVLQVTVHKSLTLFTRQAQGILLLGSAGMPELGGGRRGSCPPCLLLGGARGAKVPFKYKEYYITVSFQGAFS